MSRTTSIYVIGDIHGQLTKLTGLLRESGLIGDDLTWTGGDSALWFMGDFFDRGPDGVGVVDLVMRLQAEAAAAGGRVSAILGNHDILVLAAWRFGECETTMPGGSFTSVWRRNGGRAADLSKLTHRHAIWLTNLPAVALVRDRLLAHADATFYANYGRSVASVNWAFRSILWSADVAAWEQLLCDFCEREAFDSQQVDGAESAERVLRVFGGRQLIHGHTPIAYVRQIHPRHVTGPLLYADGLCLNVDGGMYLGGPGFVYQLPRPDATHMQHRVPAKLPTDRK